LPAPPAPRSLSRDGSLGSPLQLTTQLLPSTTATLNVRTGVNHMNGTKAKVATVTRIGSRKQIISWMDAPDDLYFCSNDLSKKLRRALSSSEMRRLARSPCKKVPPKSIPDGLILPHVLVPPPATALAATNLTSIEQKVAPVWRSVSPVETPQHHERR